LSVHLLEELSTAALDRLDRDRTVVILTVSPLEQHGPHLPVGVDAFTARHLAQSIAERVVAERPGWSAVLAPTLHVGTFTFNAAGTVNVRQRVVRDVLIDYGTALARAGFRHILVANGHAGPGHLVALEEAAAIVSRRHRVSMASLTGHLAWEFLRGRLLPKIEAALGRSLSAEEQQAFAEDSHGGWWETSVMLLLRPDLVDGAYRTLEPARYSLARRIVPNYALRNGGQGYVGHPALADPAFAKAGAEALLDEVMRLVDGLLDGRVRSGERRSPFYAIPFLRTNFLPALCAATLAGIAVAWWRRR
jgi:creatinine amidohydrolase